MADLIRFDEHENVFTFGVGLICDPACFGPPTLPATSSTNTADSRYPNLIGPDVAGWLYLNLNNGGSTSYSVEADIGGALGSTNRQTNLSPAGSTTLFGPRPSQSWVTVTMFGTLGTNRLAAEFDAASLGNGCSPAAFPITNNASHPVGPAGGVFVCPPGTTLTNGTTAQCTGTNGNPVP